LQFQITHADGRALLSPSFIEKIYELLVVGKDSDVLDLLDKKSIVRARHLPRSVDDATPLCADCDWMVRIMLTDWSSSAINSPALSSFFACAS